MSGNKKLFSEFAPVSKAEWLSKVEKDLRGKAVEELQWAITEDIVMDPIYHPEDMTFPVSPLSSAKGNDWEIGEDIPADKLENANRELLHALQNGINAPRLILERPLNADEFKTLFDKVNLAFISVHFKTKTPALPTLNSFRAYALQNEYHPSELKGSINDETLKLDKAGEIIESIHEILPGFQAFCLAIEDQGTEKSASTLVQAILQGSELLSTLSESGMSVEKVADQLFFSITVGNSYFLEIARIRALKILWLNILKAYGIENARTPVIEAHLSPKAFDKDSNTNMIKLTTQAMSAVLGGVDRLTVCPSDIQSGKPTAFAKRISRNVQHLLKMESFFDRVSDPAAGSYYIEKLTEKLAGSTWKMLQKIQRS